MEIELVHGDQRYRIKILARRQKFLQVRVKGIDTERALDVWIPAPSAMLEAFNAAALNPSEESVQRVQEAAQAVPDETHEYLIFLQDNL